MSDWWHTYDQLGSTSAVMVALRRGDVDDLNARARNRLLVAGHLTGPTVDVDGITFQAGDRIVCLRNNRRVGVVNGTRATITTVHPRTRALDVVTDEGRHISLPDDYLDDRHVAHGYAITGHKAQGLTVDHTFVLGSPELYREWGYVALSRGRHTNHLYVCATAGADDLHQHALQPDVDPITSVTARLERSRAQQPVSVDLVEQSARWRQLHARMQDPDINRCHEASQERARLVKERERVERHLARLAAKLDEHDTRVGRWRNRLELARLEADHRMASERHDSLDEQLGRVDSRLASLPSPNQVADLRDEYRDLTLRLLETARQRVASFQRDCPGYLLTAVGERPADGRGRRRWQEAALAIEHYRVRWGITDPNRPLGAEPTDPLRSDEHRLAAARVAEARRELGHERTAERGLSRSLGISLGR